MTFLNDIRKDHPALSSKQKEITTKDMAAMYNVLCKLKGYYCSIQG